MNTEEKDDLFAGEILRGEDGHYCCGDELNEHYPESIPKEKDNSLLYLGRVTNIMANSFFQIEAEVGGGNKAILLGRCCGKMTMFKIRLALHDRVLVAVPLTDRSRCRIQRRLDKDSPIPRPSFPRRAGGSRPKGGQKQKPRRKK